jgi:ATP-dependent protease HslVU (ClpYQ) peptidase subunit
VTTIATDGKSMAGDGLCTGDGLIHGRSVGKVCRLPDGRIVGSAGTAYGQQAFAEWLINGGDKPRLADSFEGLVLHPDGRCLTYNEHCQSCDQELPAVTGSGGALALGAMLAGKNPAEAVAIAADRDPFTGGTITVLHLESQP